MTPDSSVLQALREGVGKASEGSRELDCAIAQALFEWSPGYKVRLTHAYTGSIDEALRLIKRLLKGKHGPISLTIAGSAQVCIESADPCGLGWQTFGATPALALISALLAALSDTGEA